MSNFKPGDVVKLKSGGPFMTICWVKASNGVEEAYCQWFDANEPKGHTFATTSLVGNERAS